MLRRAVVESVAGAAGTVGITALILVGGGDWGAAVESRFGFLLAASAILGAVIGPVMGALVRLDRRQEPGRHRGRGEDRRE